ncbi:MAG: translocation/assembly module TamB domain-containing protein [Cellvibrionaceae bacterium]
MILLSRYLKYLLVTLLIILLISLLGFTWLTSSHSGLQWLNRQLQNALPALSIGDLDGKLIGPISIKNITYNDDDAIDISIEQLTMDWTLSSLFKATLNIDLLNISNINIYQVPTPKPSNQEAINEKEKKLLPNDLIDQLKLPIAIVFNNININKAHYYQGYKTESPPSTLQLNHFSTQGIFDRSGLNIQSIAIDSDKGNLNGYFQLYTVNSKMFDSKLKWSLLNNNLAPLMGETTLTGQLENLQINSNLETPYQSSIKLSLQNILKKIDATGTIFINNITLNKINSEWPSYTISGKSDINVNLDNLNAVTSFDIDIDPLNKLTIKNDAQWADKQLDLSGSVTVNESINTLKNKTIDFKGNIKTNESAPAITINANWQNLSWPLLRTLPATAASIDIPEGTVSIKGSANSYNFEINSRIDTPPLIADNKKDIGKSIKGKLNIIGNGNLNGVNINTLSLNSPLGLIKGKGEFIYQPTVSVNLNLLGEDINPGFILPDWPGEIDFNTIIKTGKQNKPIITSLINASGTLRDYPLSLETEAFYGEDIINIKSLELTSGKSKLSVQGKFNNNQDVSAQWSVTSKNLTEFLPKLSGSLYTQGTINSDITSPALLDTSLDMNLKGSSIQFDKIKIEQVTVETNIDWTETPRLLSQKISKESSKKVSAKTTPSTLSINLSNMTLENTQVQSVDISGSGFRQDHQLNISAQSNDLKINTKTSGRFILNKQEPEWLFSLSDATIALTDLAPWKLQKTASGGITINKQYIEKNCWDTEITEKINNGNSKKEGIICLSGAKQNNTIQSDFTINNLPTEYFSPLLPEDLEWQTSVINGEGSLISSTQQLKANIVIDTTAGQFNWQPPTKNKPLSQSISVEPGKVVINNDKNGLNASVSFPLEKQRGIYGSIAIKDNNKSFKQRPLVGEIGLALNNLRPFTPFIPDASDLKGQLSGEWQFNGSIDKPLIDGSLLMNEGQVRLSSPGIFLENIALELSGNQQQGILYQLSLMSGGGSLNIKGSADLKPKTPHINLVIKGKDAQLFATEEASLFISPDITINTNDEIIDIKGKLTIPKASITPKKVPASVVTTSDDQIIVDDEAPQKTNTLKQKVISDITLALGDNVNIDGFGFKGRATGNLQVIKEAEGASLGNGEINIINGEYRAFGQGLVIEKGAILFAGGPISKPGVDVKAVRRPAEGITVGVYARGNIAQPELTVFSEPSMTQSEQLSWLMLGRPLEQSSEGEGNAINQLLLSMSLNKGDSLLNRFGDSLNLDTVRIKSGSDEAGAASDNDLAELVLGKYLSPDLYVSYGIGLFKPVNVLSLEYSLGRNWKLISETSAESSGGDLIYTIEK